MTNPPPPPPGDASPPPPPGYPPASSTSSGWGAAPGAPPPPSPGIAPPAGGWAPAPADKPPRPKVTIGSVLVIVGAAVAILGSFLNWFSVPSEDLDVTGFTEFEGETRDGPVFVFLGAVLVGFGIAMLAAGRVLAVAILAVITATLVVLFGLVDFGDVSDAQDLIEGLGGEFEVGPGLPIIIVGGLVSLAGSIVALSKRRR